MEFWELSKYLSLHLILTLEAHRANSWEGKIDKCGGEQKQLKLMNQSPQGPWETLVSSSCLCDLGDEGVLQRLGPFLVEPGMHTWPRSQRR